MFKVKPELAHALLFYTHTYLLYIKDGHLHPLSSGPRRPFCSARPIDETDGQDRATSLQTRHTVPSYSERGSAPIRERHVTGCQPVAPVPTRSPHPHDYWRSFFAANTPRRTNLQIQENGGTFAQKSWQTDFSPFLLLARARARRRRRRFAPPPRRFPSRSKNTTRATASASTSSPRIEF